MSGVGKVLGTVTGGLLGKAPKAKQSSPGQVDTSLYSRATEDSDLYRKDIAKSKQQFNDRNATALQGSKQLVTDLQAQANGTGPSLANAQLKAATERTLAQQLATAAASRGGNPAATQRTLMNQQGIAGRNLAQDSAQARLQEQTAARQQLAPLLSNELYNTDQAVQNITDKNYTALKDATTARQRGAEVNAGYQNATNTANTALSQQQNLFNQQQQQQLFGNALSGAAMLSDETKKKDVKSADGKSTDFLDAISTTFSTTPTDFPEVPGVPAGVPMPKRQKKEEGKKSGEDMAQLAMMAAPMLSDERSKTSIKSNNTSDFLDKLEAKQYKYKQPAQINDAQLDTTGTKYGVLAQDLEKSQMGKSLVKDTPQGKMIDVAGGIGAVLASQAEMHKRLKAVESKKSGKNG